MRIRTTGLIVIGVAILAAVVVRSDVIAQAIGSTGSAGSAVVDRGQGPSAAPTSSIVPAGTSATRTVVTAVASTGTLPITRQTIGWITSPAAISLTSPQAGLVTQLVGKEGQEVKNGDLIAKLDDRVAALLHRDGLRHAVEDAGLDHGARLDVGARATTQHLHLRIDEHRQIACDGVPCARLGAEALWRLAIPPAGRGGEAIQLIHIDLVPG